MNRSRVVDSLLLPQAPAAADDVSWARRFIARPARTATELRYQRMVARLLDELEASR
jgi:hypothetical protein